jgi:hypothetical protein
MPIRGLTRAETRLAISPEINQQTRAEIRPAPKVVTRAEISPAIAPVPGADAAVAADAAVEDPTSGATKRKQPAGITRLSHLLRLRGIHRQQRPTKTARRSARNHPHLEHPRLKQRRRK